MAENSVRADRAAIACLFFFSYAIPLITLSTYDALPGPAEKYLVFNEEKQACKERGGPEVPAMRLHPAVRDGEGLGKKQEPRQSGVNGEVRGGGRSILMAVVTA